MADAAVEGAHRRVREALGKHDAGHLHQRACEAGLSVFDGQSHQPFGRVYPKPRQFLDSLSRGRDEARAAALYLLSLLEGQAAVAPAKLLITHRDSGDEMRRCAAFALAVAGTDEAFDTLFKVYFGRRSFYLPPGALAACRHPKAGNRLFEMLKRDPDNEDLIYALGELHHAPAIPAIAETLRRAPRGLLASRRDAAAHALFAMDHPDARAVLIPHLQDRDELLSRLAAMAAIQEDPRTALDRLAKWFERPGDVAFQILAALADDMEDTWLRPSCGWLAADPGWADLAARLRNDRKLGEVARHVLRHVPKEQVRAAVAKTPPVKAPAPTLPTRLDFLPRYRAGEHREVWKELTALGDSVRDPRVEPAARAVAMETMRVVRENLQTLIGRLRAEGWESEGLGKAAAPRKLADLETLAGGPLPLSLRAFFEVVGSASLILKSLRDGRRMKGHPLADLIEADPFEVFPVAVLIEDAQAWKEQCEEETPEVAGPFQAPIAPDDLHKANISGGDPYAIVLPNAAADARVENEGHELYFVDYLRLCLLKWGGFPGLEERPKRHALVDRLRDGLRPF